jgi:hypothetical protein
MAIVGRVVTRPMNSAPPIRYYSFVEMRCLLCGGTSAHNLNSLTHHPQVHLTPRDPMVVTFCDCYDSTHQDVRMIPND